MANAGARFGTEPSDPPPEAMHTPLTVARDRARADWLAGDANAWARYAACVRTLATLSPEGRPSDPTRAAAAARKPTRKGRA